uniref:Uncharacterized protein n=1 Tax=Arundo donax TaxID=35708 RepID=A0A0A8ZXP9_ARUDO
MFQGGWYHDLTSSYQGHFIKTYNLQEGPGAPCRACK